MKTVAIAGCQNRIGTTTQALQMVQCIKKLGYSAAYMEMGGQGYLKSLPAVYEGIAEEKDHLLVNEIEMYESENIIEASRKGYDYLVKDYGSMASEGFQKISFLEQDIKIIVGGVKANEIVFLEQVLEERCWEDAKYICSFVPTYNRQDIKVLMRDHQRDTYFAEYTPDPFEYQEHDIYEYILGE